MTAVRSGLRLLPNTGPAPTACPDCDNTGEWDHGPDGAGFCTCPAGITLWDELRDMVDDKSESPGLVVVPGGAT